MNRFTDILEQWMLHNNIGILAARISKLKNKASVENEVEKCINVYIRPCGIKSFFSLKELNSHIVELLKIHR